MAGSEAATSVKAVDQAYFRGGLFTLMVLRMGDPKDQDFFNGVMEKVAQAPNFFRNAPIVLDLQDLADAPPFNIAELVRRLRQHLLVPFAVQNATEEQGKAAVNAGLAILPEGRQPREQRELRPAPPPQEPPGEATRKPATGGAATTLVFGQPVRSGRQIYAEGGDLVVLGPISPGAELLADGHIHVYGALRGRAHAGVGGNGQARIFCRSLEAELVSIAGFWRVRDDMPEDLIGKPAQLHLDGERLVIEPSP
jgi:septum site-determining protein MinC